MAYENLSLLVASVSNEIYLTKILKSGFMGDSRRIITRECLVATTEWFMANQKKMAAFAENNDGQKPHLFYTGDKNKAERILAILEEEE